MSENALVTTTQRPGIAPASLGQAIEFAKLMADSSLVPKHLQGKAPDCFLVVEQATRWGMSPFAVAQCTSVISGKLMFEGKLVTAVVNALAGLEGGLDFTYEGEGDNRSCTAIGKKPEWKEARSVRVVLKDVRTSNEHWKKQPDQQLCYSASRNWARRFAPELMLGVYSPEEMDYIPPPPANDAQKAAVARGGNAPKRSTAQEAPAQPEAPKAASSAVEAATPIADCASDTTSIREPGSDDGDVTEDQETVPTWDYDDARGEWLPGPRAQKRTEQQNKAMHALAKELGLSEQARRAKTEWKFNKKSSAELSVDEMDDFLDHLRGLVQQRADASGRRAGSSR